MLQLSTETPSDLQPLLFPPTQLVVQHPRQHLEDGMEEDRVDEAQHREETITTIKQMMIGSLRELELLLEMEVRDRDHRHREEEDQEDSEVHL